LNFLSRPQIGKVGKHEDVEPDANNGLLKRSRIMVDKAQTVPTEKIGKVIGILDAVTLMEVNRTLALWLGYADNSG